MNKLNLKTVSIVKKIGVPTLVIVALSLLAAPFLKKESKRTDSFNLLSRSVEEFTNKYSSQKIIDTKISAVEKELFYKSLQHYNLNIETIESISSQRTLILDLIKKNHVDMKSFSGKSLEAVFTLDPKKLSSAEINFLKELIQSLSIDQTKFKEIVKNFNQMDSKITWGDEKQIYLAIGVLVWLVFLTSIGIGIMENETSTAEANIGLIFFLAGVVPFAVNTYSKAADLIK